MGLILLFWFEQARMTVDLIGKKDKKREKLIERKVGKREVFFFSRVKYVLTPLTYPIFVYIVPSTTIQLPKCRILHLISIFHPKLRRKSYIDRLKDISSLQ